MASLLKGHQSRLVDKLSELVVASSSSGADPFESVSSLSDNGVTKFWTEDTYRMIKSKNSVDKKLLNFFKFKKQQVRDQDL